MTAKQMYENIALAWYALRPLRPQYRSRQAWLDYCKAHGLPSDGGSATLPKVPK